MFKPYRFSPIKNEIELLETIEFLHFACFKLCNKFLSKYLPIAGNVGIFCHYDKEYKSLIEIRKKLTESSNNPNQKYFKLHRSIIVPAHDEIPGATYTHIYIRKPDPYRYQVGDIDFILDKEAYFTTKKSLIENSKIKGARVFDRAELDMIELYDPDIDALGYIITKQITLEVRAKINPPKK